MIGDAGADVFKWELTDRSVAGSPDIDTVFEFNLNEGDKLDLRDLLVDEDSNNLANYLDITTSGEFATIIETEIRISSQGNFTNGNYSANSEDAHITLTGSNGGLNLFAVTGSSTEADLIQYLINNNHLIVDG